MTDEAPTTRRRTPYSRLAPAECEALHAASLEILERTGVRLLEPEAVELLERAGASISEGNRARIPARLVERALDSAPRRIVLHDRAGRPVMPLEGARTYFGPGSDCPHIVDHRTGERRRAVLEDVRDAARLCDALSNIQFVMSLFIPSDVPPALADRHQFESMLRNTTKPIVFVTYEMSGCADAVEMAEAVVGGAAALRERPFVACYVNVTSGLVHNADALQKLLFLSEKGLPALYVPVVSGGTSGPMTMAGGLALTTAGALAGLVISQQKREGAPFVLPGFGGDALDMRTMVDPYCAPEPRGMAESLGHHYGLPLFTLGGSSESKLVDGQASVEAGLTMLLGALTGGHLFHDLGYLESGLTGSLAQLAICNEIAGWIRSALAPVEITPETLALDLIDVVGPEGSFLKLPHTRRHMRERWYPALFDRDNHAGWLSKGGRPLSERAAEQVTRLLERHRPEPLSAAASEAVAAVFEPICRRVEGGRV
ncbi:MAG: trimethylamine methyltransferase family protein, partial [Syntrophomonadaceae bacterium]